MNNDSDVIRDVEQEFIDCVGKIIELYAQKSDTLETYNSRIQGAVIAMISVSNLLKDLTKTEAERISIANKSIDVILNSMGDLLDEEKIRLTDLHVPEQCAKTNEG